MPDLEKLGWEAPEEGNPEPKIKVRSTTGFRIGGELAYDFNYVDGPNYNGPYPQMQNARFGYRASTQGKELTGDRYHGQYVRVPRRYIM